MFTLGNLAFFGAVIIIGICIVVLFAAMGDDDLTRWVSIICGIVFVIIVIATGWYNTHTATGQRALKDNKSNINNGIEREILITAEDGREIFRYEGKVDIESNHTDNYIKFESEEGKRYIIYYGIQDTIQIIEK